MLLADGRDGGHIGDLAVQGHGDNGLGVGGNGGLD